MPPTPAATLLAPLVGLVDRPGGAAVAGVALAVLAAVLLALGTGLQTAGRTTTAGPAGMAGTAGTAGTAGRRRTAPLARPAWWAGPVVLAAGAALGAAALALAPVSLVQPVGVLALPLAMAWTARRTGRRPGPAELSGAAACVLGVAGLVLLLAPGGESAASAPPVVLGPAAWWPLVAGAAAGLTGSRRPAGPARVVLLGLGAGLCFGTVAALTRLVLPPLVAGQAPAPTTVLLLALALATGLSCLHGAGRAGHHSLLVAVLTVTDPLVAVALGAVLLGEPLPVGPAGLAAAGAALLTVTGVLVLARTAPDPRPPLAQPARPLLPRPPGPGPGSRPVRRPLLDGARA